MIPFLPLFSTDEAFVRLLVSQVHVEGNVDAWPCLMMNSVLVTERKVVDSIKFVFADEQTPSCRSSLMPVCKQFRTKVSFPFFF